MSCPRPIPWQPEEDQALRLAYGRVPTAELARMMERTPVAVKHRALKLRLRAPNNGRFVKGQVPSNKGLRRPGWAPGRMAETQFKPGRPATAAHNYVPIGTEKVCPHRGALLRKMSDDLAIYPAGRWTPVHRLVWEAAHGPVPNGHFVRFKAGMKTLVAADITLDRLELVTPSQHIRTYSVHNYPPEIIQAIRAKGALVRAINRTNNKDLP